MEYDVAVIGGGPAGAAAAITAAKRDRSVLVVEADVFPRHHVGESLVYVWPALRSLGVAEVADRTFQHKLGGTRIWGEDTCPRFSGFGHLPGRQYSLQVERALFDQLLLRRAGDMGATILQGTRVLEVLWEDARAQGIRYQTAAGPVEVSAAFVIDAGGRRSTISGELRLRDIDTFYPDLAVYGYFEGATRLPREHDGDLIIEAVPGGWIWFIPLHTGRVSVGLVTDRSSRAALRRQKARSFLLEAVAHTELIAGLLSPVQLVEGPITTAAFGYTSRQYAGPGWMLAGDAAFFTDPMWATGVGNALSSGILAGATASAVLDGRVGEPEAMKYYDREMSGVVSSIDATVKFVYGCNQLYAGAPFWARRHRYLAEHPPPMEKVTTVFGPSVPRMMARLTGTYVPAVHACP